MKFRGVVLAGGRSRRFGSDKALASFDGQPMIERALALLDGLGLNPVISARHAGDYASLNRPVVEDTFKDSGPLGGLHAAMRALEGCTLVILTCDMPRVDADLIEGLRSAHRKGDAPISIYASPGPLGEMIEEPFPGIYHSALAERVCAQISRGTLSMSAFLKSQDRRRILAKPCGGDFFANINTSSDSAGFVLS